MTKFTVTMFMGAGEAVISRECYNLKDCVISSDICTAKVNEIIKQ